MWKYLYDALLQLLTSSWASFLTKFAKQGRLVRDVFFNDVYQYSGIILFAVCFISCLLYYFYFNKKFGKYYTKRSWFKWMLLRIFPDGMKASPLLRAWLRRLEGLGVTRKTPQAWTGFDDVPTILAMGGASWPELGSDAAWVRLFNDAGIDVAPMSASNSRQRVAWSREFTGRFAGQPVKNVAVSVAGGAPVGELLIAEDGIEGGAVYAMARHLRAPGTSLQIDLKPDLSAQQVAERLSRPRGKDLRSTYLRKTLNLSPAAIALMRETGGENPKEVMLSVQGPVDTAAPYRRQVAWRAMRWTATSGF